MQSSIKVGDIVRVENDTILFKKGYKNNYRQEEFKVVEKKENLPIPLFRLQRTQDKNGSKIKEGEGAILYHLFYESELQTIEKEFGKRDIPNHSILKTRQEKDGTDSHFVSWKGVDEKFNTWIPERILKWEGMLTSDDSEKTGTRQ